MFDLRHPFFRPPLRRAVTTAIAGGWALFELSTGAVFWAILFGAIAAWCIYEFYIVFDPANYEEKDRDA